MVLSPLSLSKSPSMDILILILLLHATNVTTVTSFMVFLNVIVLTVNGQATNPTAREVGKIKILNLDFSLGVILMFHCSLSKSSGTCKRRSYDQLIRGKVFMQSRLLSSWSFYAYLQ